MGQNFAFALLKSTLARKKYTTAGCGSCDLYELCPTPSSLNYCEIVHRYWDHQLSKTERKVIEIRANNINKREEE